MIDVAAAVTIIVGINFFAFAAKQANRQPGAWVFASLVASLLTHVVLGYSWGGILISQIVVFVAITVWRLFFEESD